MRGRKRKSQVVFFPSKFLQNHSRTPKTYTTLGSFNASVTFFLYVSMNIASDLRESFSWSWNPKLCKVQLSHSLEFNGGLIFNCSNIFHIFHTACWSFLIKWLWIIPHQMIMNKTNSGDEMHKSISAVRHLEPWGNYSFPTFSNIQIGGGFEFWLILIQSMAKR